MFEVTIFDQGLEVGTWDWDVAPVVGEVILGDCLVTGIREMGDGIASVDVEYV